MIDLKQTTLFLLKSYKKYISPFLERLFGKACRFHPSCSQYTIDAIEKKGLRRGVVLGFFRFLRCNPLFRAGYDPVK